MKIHNFKNDCQGWGWALYGHKWLLPPEQKQAAVGDKLELSCSIGAGIKADDQIMVDCFGKNIDVLFKVESIEYSDNPMDMFKAVLVYTHAEEKECIEP